MKKYRFPGYPIYLDHAADQIGHPEAVSGARRLVSLAVVANLCAQASEVAEEQVEPILEKALEVREELRMALEAVDLMIQDVRIGRGVDWKLKDSESLKGIENFVDKQVNRSPGRKTKSKKIER